MGSPADQPPERPAEGATQWPSPTPRRTWLAAERTWLAWWRTALGTAALAIGVGRVLPTLAHTTRWPYALLGVGYAVLTIFILWAGWRRQRVASRALLNDDYAGLSDGLVAAMTLAALVLAVTTLVLVIAGA